MTESIETLQNNNDAGDSAESYRETAKDLLIAFKWPLIIVGIIIGASFGMRTVDKINPPAWVYTDLHWLAISIILGGILMKPILEALITKDVNPLLTINYENINVMPRLYNLGDESWAEMDIEGGKLVGDGILKVAVDYDPEENVAQGVPIEDMSEMQILRFKHKLKEARNMLWKQAVEGMAAQEAARLGVFMATKTSLRQALQTVVDEGALHGDDINDIVDTVMQEAAIDDIFSEMEDMAADDVDLEGENADESVLRDARSIEAQAENPFANADINTGDEDE